MISFPDNGNLWLFFFFALPLLRFLGFLSSSQKHTWLFNSRWHSGKESACQSRRQERCRFDPWVRKIPWSKKWQPTQVFLPGKFNGQSNLTGFVRPMGLQRLGQDWETKHSTAQASKMMPIHYRVLTYSVNIVEELATSWAYFAQWVSYSLILIVHVCSVLNSSILSNSLRPHGL